MIDPPHTAPPATPELTSAQPGSGLLYADLKQAIVDAKRVRRDASDAANPAPLR